MKPSVLYELRVLSGEQRGAASSLAPGAQLRIGESWSDDVVLHGAAGSAARLKLGDDDTLAVQLDGGDGSVDGDALAMGEELPLALYTPFTVGGVRMAVGRIGAPQWAALFDDAPAASQAAADADHEALAAEAAAAAATDAAMTPPPPRRRGGWPQRLLAGGAALVGLSAGALTLAWAMGPGTLTPPEQEQQLRHTLAHLGFGNLRVERRDGALMVAGHLGTEAERRRLEQGLSGQTPAQLAVWVNEQVAAAVADVYRLNGIASEVKAAGAGVVQVQTKEGDLEKLKHVQAKARRDVPGLVQLLASNDAPPVAPKPEPLLNDPGKRVAAIVPGDPAYVVTADGTRYFQGALLPTGHRIVAILSDRVHIERDGAASTLTF